MIKKEFVEKIDKWIFEIVYKTALEEGYKQHEKQIEEKRETGILFFSYPNCIVLSVYKSGIDISFNGVMEPRSVFYHNGYDIDIPRNPDYITPLSDGEIKDLYDYTLSRLRLFFPESKKNNDYMICEDGRVCLSKRFLPCQKIEDKYVCYRCLEDRKKITVETGGYAYIFGDESTGYCKIGASKKPTHRLSQYKQLVPFNVAMIHTIDTDDKFVAEGMLHRMFKEKRQLHEWFLLNENDIRYIKSIRSCYNNEFIFKT